MPAQPRTDPRPPAARAPLGRSPHRAPAARRSSAGRAGTAVAIGAVMALCWVIGYVVGGAGVVPPLWFFLPILLAAWWFGTPAALLVALGSAFIAGPLTPAEVAQHAPQATSDWITRGAFFIAMAAVMGLVLRHVKATTVAAEQAREQAQSLLDSAGEGIYGVDADGLAMFVNPAAERLTGYAGPELIGRRLHDLLHHSHPDGSHYPAGECPILRPLTDGTRYEGEDVFWHKDGTSFPVSCTSMPLVQNGSVAGAVVVFRDISERREVERRKDEFTATVSHELRTPLTSVRGSLGLMAGGALGELPPKATRMLAIALANTDRLIRLINDILDVERMQSGRVEMHPEEADAGALVDRAIAEVRGVADQAAVTLTAQLSAAAVWADGDRVIQTLVNLLSNAIKFSEPGATVEVAVRSETDAGSHGGEAVFAVTDTGRGIPADKLHTIFGRFEQVDASDSREKGGTGLGLTICESIVTQHGGRIWVESTPGQGSTFTFTIPLARPAEPSAEHDDRITVALCEDDPGVREVVAEMLGRHGYRVRRAASGEQLLELVARDRPAAVVLDLLLGGMDGWETVVRLDAASPDARLPLVIATVLPPEEVGPLAARAAAVVHKPLEEHALVAAVTRALQNAAVEAR